MSLQSSTYIKRALQKFPLQKSVTAKSGERNLIEMISRFPKQGAGMKVFRKTWPENCYYHLYWGSLKDNKSGKLYGIKYWNGERVADKIEPVRGASKRGIWQFDINQQLQITPQEIEKYEMDKAQEAAAKEAEEKAAQEAEAAEGEEKEEAKATE